MRKCTENDRVKILKYIEEEPEMNLFIYGDIENFGVDSENVSIYVEEKEGSSEWDSLLLRYFDYYILYSKKTDYDMEAVYALLQDKTPDCLSGKTRLVSRMVGFYPDKRLQSTYMCRCNTNSFHAHDASDGCAPGLCRKQEAEGKAAVSVRRLTKEDIPQIMELFLLIEEFADTYRNREEKAKKEAEFKLESGSLSYGVFENGKLVAIAETSADNSISAMVVSVATHPDYRKKGYAMTVVSELCKASFAQGKQFLCLFYDNPEAGKIYHKIGFETVGEYAMLR